MGEIDRVKAIAATGTAESFLALSDDDKKLFFASAVEESALCKKLSEEIDRLKSFVVTCVNYSGSMVNGNRLSIDANMILGNGPICGIDPITATAMKESK